MDSSPAIVLKNISLKYYIDIKDDDKKQTLLRRNPTKKAEHVVLDGIDLTIEKGEIVGIIGTNGSGKSSLLSIIAKILKPDSGTVEITGKVATILELGMGFHPDLSGRENIILKGELYGFSKKQMEAKIDNIIDYSGIRNYIDNPVRTYSSGMQSRLAFSIMIHVESDIMLVDEILSTGDMAFSAKATDFFKKILKDGKTVVYVSHTPGAMETLCTRVVWLKDGKIIADGKPKKVCALYKEATMNSFDIIFDQAQSGLSDAQYRLSQLYKNGIDVEQNNELYHHWLSTAAEQGHLKAQVECADYLINSDDEKDCELALNYYQSSAARGDPSAKSKLSTILGNREYRKEYNEIKMIFQKLAERNTPQDMFRYATFLLKTAWTSEDYKDSFDWFKKVAEEYDHPDAIIQLATMYRDGIGVKKDNQMYISTLIKGDSLGITKLSIMLADCYMTGALVEEDFNKAFQIYEKCATNGSSLCQYTLGMMYLEGKGVEPNPDMARHWFNLYSKSQLVSHQLNAIALMKENVISGVIDIDSLYEKIHYSKDPKALIELARYLNERPQSNEQSIELPEIYEYLAKSYGRGMSLAFNYYAERTSSGYDISKAIEVGKKCIYTGNPDLLYKIALMCFKSDSSEEIELGIKAIRIAAILGHVGSIHYCINNNIKISMPE